MRNKITGVSTFHVCGGIFRFAGFYLDGIVGAVDPFVDAQLDANNCFDAQIVDDETALPFEEFAKRELAWANSMVGKYLVCERLAYSAFATIGEVGFEQ